MKKQIITGVLVFLAMVLVVLATPVFNPISNQTVNEAQTATVNVVLSSTNGTTSFTLAPATAWAAIARVDDTHATITLNPGYDVVTGASTSQGFDFTVTATDADGSATQSFTATVNNINRNPTITGETVTVGYYDDTKEHTISASDPDGDTLSYSVTAAGDANIAQCSITGTNTLKVERKTDSSGSTTCTVLVTDGKGGSATANFPINVREVSKLKIDKIKISGDVDSQTYNEDDLDSTMSIKDVIPGGEFEVKITLENLYTDDEDLQIENIEVDGTIFDVDTGDDKDDIDSDTFEIDKIKPEKDDIATLVFDIPLVVEDGSYDMEIYINAEDEDGKDFDITLNFDLEIKKESYEVAIKDVSASPTVVKAGKSFSLDVAIVNIGTKDEDDGKITVESTDMNFFTSEANIELDNDISADDNVYETTFMIDIPEDTEPGDYLFEIEAYHDKDELDDSETVTITVEAPAAAQQQAQAVEVQQMTEQESQMITQTTTGAGITQTTEGQSFTESGAFMILLIVGIVVVVILIILLLLLAFRRY
jgi:hypothetical protein